VPGADLLIVLLPKLGERNTNKRVFMQIPQYFGYTIPSMTRVGLTIRNTKDSEVNPLRFVLRHVY